MTDLRESLGALHEVLGEGEGWIAWRHDNAMHVTVLDDDGQGVKSIAVRDTHVIDDMLASAKWVASLSDMERDRALAAVECLETVDG